MERSVLFTASTFSHIVNFHRPYLHAFAERGWRVDVACGGTVMDIPEAHRIIPIAFEKSISSPKNLAALRHLRREIGQQQHSLISCHTSLASFFTRMAVLGQRNGPWSAPPPTDISSDDQTSTSRRMLLAGAERLAAPVTDLLMTMNQWDTDFATEHRLGRRFVKIPGMGVDFHQLRRTDPDAGRQLRQEWGFGPENFLLVYGAEFSHRKDQATLLHSLTQLPEGVGLLLPGSGQLREECMALAGQLGLEGRVAFPGQVRDMAPWYAAADAAISSSRSEGLPFNIMEAMYLGLPVVATRVKGHTDLIQDGETGLLFPYGDSAACAAQIQRMLDETDLAGRLGAEGARRAQSYALSQVLPQVMEVYEGLLPLGQPTAEPVGQR